MPKHSSLVYINIFRAAGGGMVDVTPETQANLKRDLERLATANGGTAEQLANFPTFTFTGEF